MAATRDGYGRALLELGNENNDVIVLDSDLSASTRTKWFADSHPSRFINCGVAEQNMITFAAGLATCGKIVFASTFAVFAVERAYNQIKQSIVYSDLNVKIVASHGGITVGPDGTSHHMPFDFATMRVLPDLVVLSPADAIEAYWATKTIAKYIGPVYMRLSRPPTPLIFEEKYQFKNEELKFTIGKAIKLRDGSDATIFANGIMVFEALKAAEELALSGVDAQVVNIHTIKPLDEELVIQLASETGAIISAEEHSVIGGLGSAIAEVLVRNNPVPMEMIGIKDVFTLSGSPKELMTAYGLTATDIVAATNRAISRKN
jgi:transketolase